MRVGVESNKTEKSEVFTEVKHRPPEIVLGICRINFTTASVDYMSSVGLIYFNVIVCVCVSVSVSVSVSVLFRYLSPVLLVLSVGYSVPERKEHLYNPPPPHTHTHTKRKKKKGIF